MWGLASWGVARGAPLDVTPWSWGFGVVGALVIDTPEVAAHWRTGRQSR